MVSTVLSRTFHLLKSKPFVFWSPLVPVVLVDVVLSYAQIYGHIPDNAFVELLFTALSVVLAVTTHRLVLLGSGSVPKFGFRLWGYREALFAVYTIGIGVVLLVPGLFIVVIVAPILEFNVGFAVQVTTIIFALLISIPFAIVAARLSMALPATAVGDSLTFRGSWQATKGRSFSMFFIFWIIPIALALPVLIFLLFDSQLAELAILPVSSLGLVVEIAALSISYRVLVIETGP